MLEMIISWFKNNIEVVFMGIAGCSISALISDKSYKEKIVSFLVGFILALALSGYTANALTDGAWQGAFGFIYGLGGITLAKMIHKFIEKRAKQEIENRTGVKTDDDN